MHMRQSGRGNWIIVALVAIVLAIAALVVFAGETPTAAAKKFMRALSRQDAEALADMSFYDPPRPREEVVASWKRTLKLSEHYIFAWQIKNSKSPVKGRATVSMDFIRDASKGTSYPEIFPLDLIQKDGKWMVDVRALSREMYPALPR